MHFGITRTYTRAMNRPDPSPHPDSVLIDKLGGTAEVARLCQIKAPSVSEWRVRGIPQARRLYLALLRPDLFEGESGDESSASEAA